MYDNARYMKDIKKAWGPAEKAIASFLRKLLSFDLFKAFPSCIGMFAKLILFVAKLMFFTGRRIVDR
jgi:hypothetical protein